MRRNLRFIIVVLMSVFSQITSAQAAIKAEIETLRSGDFITIKALANNLGGGSQELSYTLLVLREGLTGISSNKQQGEFKLNAKERKMLSTSTANVTKNDRLRAYLYIRDHRNNHLITMDSLVLNAMAFQQTVLPDETIAFSGLVIDNTRSRAGRDFYEKFYIKYNQKGDKYNFIISINELPSQSNSGKITLECDDQEIYSFVSMPNEDYLEAQAETALEAVQEYQDRKELLEKELKT